MDYHVILALFHVFFVAPLLIYVGVQRASTPELVFNGLIVLAIVIFSYHLYRAYTKWLSQSSGLWINLIHIGLVAPLLFWIGYYKKDTTRPAFEMLLLLAFAALGYNLKSLIVETNTVSGKAH
jgi:uncharacterized membrane protein